MQKSPENKLAATIYAELVECIREGSQLPNQRVLELFDVLVEAGRREACLREMLLKSRQHQGFAGWVGWTESEIDAVLAPAAQRAKGDGT